MGKLLPLTGIRAIAAFWVVLFHFRYLFTYGPLNPIVDKGYLGVDLFFILSGFIISYVHQQEFLTLNLKAMLHFWVLRIARIFPVHYFTILLMLISYAAQSLVLKVPFEPLDPAAGVGQQFIAQLLNLQAWGLADREAWNIPAWSVSAEWFAYLCFPVLMLWMGRLKSATGNLLVVAGSFLALALFSLLLGLHDIAWTIRYGLVRVGFEFLIGCALFNLFKLPQQKAFSANILVNGALVLLLAGAALQVPDLLMVAFLACFLYGLSQGEGRVAAFLARPTLVYWGEVSFSVYMIHGIVEKSFIALAQKFNLLQAGLPWYQSLVLFVVLLSIVLGAAQLMYMWIEVPARNLIRRKIANRMGYQRP